MARARRGARKRKLPVAPPSQPLDDKPKVKKKEEPEESGSDIVCLDDDPSYLHVQPSSSNPILHWEPPTQRRSPSLIIEPEAENLIEIDRSLVDNSLETWRIENAIPADWESTLIGVTFSGESEHLAFANSIRARHEAACKELDQAIYSHYGRNGQNSRIFQWKMQARNKLHEEFKNLFYENHMLNLWAVGSTVNGCGSFNSDMDLCLCLPEITSGGPVYFTERSRCLKILRKIQGLLRQPKLRTFIKGTQVISAKVPIIKVDLQPPYTELDLDINVNNVAGVYNSHLIHYYSKIDVRFPALCLLVKHWAIRSNISDAMNGTFNSYSLILLVLHYLQCGVKPAVLPNLQYLMPLLFSSRMPLDKLQLFKTLEGLPRRPVNTLEIGDLLMGFFYYYHTFDFDKFFISVRGGKKFERSVLPNQSDDKYYIFIEEPFDLINTARCVTREPCFIAIKKAFKEAVDAFQKFPPSLSRIGIQM